MQPLPETIETAEQLDEVLSRPHAPTVELMKRLDGDIMVLGAGGKIGPTVVRTACRAVAEAGVKKRVIAVARNPTPDLAAAPSTCSGRAGAETIACDLMDRDAVDHLPKVRNVIYMVGRKFGSAGAEHLTWGTNVIAACHAAEAMKGSAVVAFSTGCVYPLADIAAGGCTESTPPGPVGEYAMSCLARERVFDYYARKGDLRVLHFRLNYAVELRYGVLYDVAEKVWRGEPIDVTTGYANVIWQGDAANQAIRSLELAAAEPRALNVTGPETISVRQTAGRMARLMGKAPVLTGRENGLAYLSDARQAAAIFGPPTVPTDQIMDWVAHWVRIGGGSLGKPTHYQTQDGKY